MIAVALGAAVGLLGGRRPPPAFVAGAGPTDLVLLVAGLAAVGCSRLPTTGAAAALAVTGYGLLALLAVRLRHHPGMAMVAAGLLSNLAVILADAGMPVTTMDPGAVSGLHHGLTSADRLTALADIISVPVLGVTASPGDLVLSLGAALAAFAWLTATGTGHPDERQQTVPGRTPDAR